VLIDDGIGKGRDVPGGSGVEIGEDRAEPQCGNSRAHHVDRRALEGDRSGQRNQLAAGRINQRELVRHQPPAGKRQRCAERALARPGRGRQKRCDAVFLDNSRMDDEPVVADRAHAPVEPPFEQPVREPRRDLAEGSATVHAELSLWANIPAQARPRPDFH
jgi:hypothetical protein